MISCLNDYFGLSQNPCNCPAFAAQPTDVSNSGYFVDDEIEIQSFAYGECGQGSVWDILTDAKKKALLDFDSDFAAELSKQYKPKAEPFFDYIGTRTSGQVNTSTNQIHGVRIDKTGGSGSKLQIKKIMIGVTLGGTSTLKVWKAYSENNITTSYKELVSTETITLLSNQYAEITLANPVDVILKDGEHYYITYTLPASSYPFTNKYPTCGGCTKTNTEWRKSTMFYGFSASTEDDILTASYSDEAHGMSLETSIYCDISGWYCDLAKFGAVNANYKVVAKALTFLTASNAINTLLRSNRIDFTLLNNKENLYNEKRRLTKEYTNRLEWLSTQFPVSQYSCMSCNEVNAIRKTSLIL